MNSNELFYPFADALKFNMEWEKTLEGKYKITGKQKFHIILKPGVKISTTLTVCDSFENTRLKQSGLLVHFIESLYLGLFYGENTATLSILLIDARKYKDSESDMQVFFLGIDDLAAGMKRGLQGSVAAWHRTIPKGKVWKPLTLSSKNEKSDNMV